MNILWAIRLSVVLLLTAGTVAACATAPAPQSSPSPGAVASRPSAPAPSGPGVGIPEAAKNCSRWGKTPSEMQQALEQAVPGDRICLDGDMGDARLIINRPGTEAAPITVLGAGKTVVHGISIDADNITIDGIHAKQPESPGIQARGNNITITNNVISAPQGGDGDGIRFWGRNIKIVHNTISDTRGRDERHADCMQTFATDDQFMASQEILIEQNRCERIDNICLIAEGPNSEAGDGSGDGRSTNFIFLGNYCDNGAGQALFFDDVSNVSIANNDITGAIDKAFSFQNNATGAHVQGNRLNPKIGYQVGMDDSSRAGYVGPEPGGDP